jgi:hypothetical protein
VSLQEIYKITCGSFDKNAKVLMNYHAFNRVFHGGVPELADGLDLGSSAAMRGGSSPPFPTTADDVFNN